MPGGWGRRSSGIVDESSLFSVTHVSKLAVLAQALRLIPSAQSTHQSCMSYLSNYGYSSFILRPPILHRNHLSMPS